ncbi:unnamed protein product [Candidula unifasciata]|uniref:G-protein coupled receptors family 1 profile domain-containing protein n=1 Tax=Candidula unifasciata TaxID=100452 RepID=A0A8S3YZ84_9EUPU|nr:unnamed protein product [Candidula unifasciata]
MTETNSSRSNVVDEIRNGTTRWHANKDLGGYILTAIEIFTNCFLINTVCLFGVVGNILNVVVLCKHGFRETTNIILVSLSVSDLMFCIIVPVTKVRMMFSFFSLDLSVSVHTFVTVFLFMPKYVCLASSCCYVSIIAVERFIAVFFPFHASKIFTRHSMRLMCICVPIITACSMFPTFFALKYEWVFDFRWNKTTAFMQYTNFYIAHQAFIDTYVWVGLSNGFCATSITIVTVCCLAIGFKLTKAAIKREQMTRKAVGKEKVVKMLVTVCLIYISVSIPTLALYSYYQPSFIFISPLYELVDNFGVLLSSINASANFVVYVTMSDKFANTYRKMLACSRTPILKNNRGSLSKRII